MPPHRFSPRLALWVGVLGLIPSQTWALTAAEAFAAVSPSVLSMSVSDGEDRELVRQTAVMLGDGRLVTVCDALQGRDRLRVQAAGRNLPASLIKRDRHLNLCLLSVADRDIPAATPAIGDAAPGTKVYAISNIQGLGIAVTEGVVGGLRSLPSGRFIQFSASIAPGSQGGALFDGEGRLLGLIDSRPQDGQNVNFARPLPEISAFIAAPHSDIEGQRFFDEALVRYRAQDWKALQGMSQERLAGFSDDTEAWTFLAAASLALGDDGEANRAREALQGVYPDAPWPGTGLVQLWLRKGKRVEALALARSLLSRRREDASVWALVGMAEALGGSREKGDEALARALQLNPWEPIALAGTIAQAEARQDWLKAASILEYLSTLAPQDAKLRHQLYLYLLRAGKPVQAYRVLSQLAPEARELGVELLWQGRILLALGRPLAAIDALQRSLDRGVEPADQAWGALGLAYSGLHRFPEAIAAYREARRLGPEQIDWERGLTIALKDGGHPKEAIALAEGRTARDPTDATAWRHLGLALAINDEADRSVEALRKALELDPRQGKVWAALIEQYGILGRRDEALRSYRSLRLIDERLAQETHETVVAPLWEAQP